MTRNTLGTLIATGALCICGSARAVGTEHFSLDSAPVLSEGKLEGTSVKSDGTIVPSVEIRKLDLENVNVARCLLVSEDGTAYVGTGSDGKIFKVAGSRVSLFAETKQVLVTSLAMDGAGTLYAGTLPEGKIFAIDKAGKAEEFVAPENAKHVWALEYDDRKRTLFAATGPEGKIFAVDAQGKASVYLDTDADHVMALGLDDGVLYAGTSGDALLLRVHGPGKSEVVYDFEGNEVTAIDVAKGRIAVAANLFPKAPAATPKAAAKTSDNQANKSETSKAQARPQPGKGALWRIDADGRARKLFDSAAGHITQVQWGDDGAIYAATGKGGDVYRVMEDGTHGLWIDVDERQVLDIHLTGKWPLIVTGDGGAIYRVVPGVAREALWTSKALDSRFRARWGQLTWRGEGSISLQTRSGATEKPENGGWSEWSAPLTKPGPIRSPAGRFLQIRARLGTQPSSVLYAIEAYYLAQNQSATITSVKVGPHTATSTTKAKTAPDLRGSAPGGTTSYKVEWKVDNPDEDPLRYRLYFQREGQTQRRAILRDSDVVTGTSHVWDTNSVPDGHYRVEVEVSDEFANPGPYTLTTRALSEPFVIDNHAPHLVGLNASGGHVLGSARDGLGPISKLEYSVDGLEWKTFFPKDDLFDTAEERFDLDLTGLSPGRYLVAVRATDARSNTTTTQLEVSVK